MNYLEAVQETGTDDADKVVADARGQEDQRRLPAQRRDPQGGPPRHPRRLPRRGQVGKDEVTEEWDYQKIVKTIPAAEAFKPVDGSCTMS